MRKRAAPRLPIKIARIDHIVLRVRDTARCIRFWRDVLGVTVERRRPGLGLVHLRAGASMIDLVDLNGPLGKVGGAGPRRKGGRNMDHVALRIERFDEGKLRRHLTRFGIDMGMPADRFGADGDGPSVYIADPEGNVIELKG